MITSEEHIRKIIEEVIASLHTKSDEKLSSATVTSAGQLEDESGEKLDDITTVDLRKEILVPKPANREIYLKLKATTPARLGIWRSGSRPLTRSLIRFRADHAIAQDAVFSDVSEEFLQQMGWPVIQSCCRDKDEFLTRPDLGRKLDEEQTARLKDVCRMGARVQIVIADGLSSTAIESNAADTCLAIAQGLKGFSIDCTEPVFIKYGRVPIMDSISEILDPEVTVLLIGERPGLATGESMSCYMAYKASSAMPESHRTVISNIHDGGTSAVEAGAHIAEVVKNMLEQKASGLDLKL